MSFKSNVPPDQVLSPCPQVWKLADRGDVFVWSESGQTLAFAKELAEVIKAYALNGEGLPPITSILFIFAALRKHSSTPPKFRGENHAEDFENLLTKLLVAPTMLRRQPDFPLEHVASWLNQLNHIPTELSTSPRHRAHLLSTLFANLPSRLEVADTTQTRDIVTWLEVHSSEREELPSEEDDDPAGCKKALDALAFAAANSPNIESLELKLRTGLSDLPSPDSDEIDDSPSSYSEFIDSLVNDPELSRLARLSKIAASVLAMPRQPSEPDELPAGGVSDITNRGHPERLLTTELAADPMLLLARIATGQALYLRREKPPATNQEARRVFIESSIRMWGSTRIRALALAMAVAASEEQRKGPQPVFATASETVIDEDLNTRAGIIAQLERLDTSHHPGDSLKAAMLSEQEGTTDEAEPLLILSAETDRDEAFRECIRELPTPYLVARIDRDGEVVLLRRSRLGDDRLHTQRLNLEDALPQKTQSKHNDDLPLFETMGAPRPLLTSASLDGKWYAAGLGPTLWLVDQRKRLLHFTSSARGAQEIATLPSNRIVAESLDSDTLRLVMECGQNTSRYYVLGTFNASGSSKFVRLRADPNMKFVFDRRRLVSLGRRLVSFIDQESGETLASIHHPNEMDPRKAHLDAGLFTTRSEDGRPQLSQVAFEAGLAEWHVLGFCPNEIGLAIRNPDGVPVIYGQRLDWKFDFSPDASPVDKTGFASDSSGIYRVLHRSSDGKKAIVEPKDRSAPSSSRYVVWLDSPRVCRVTNRTIMSSAYTLDTPAAKLVQHRSARCKLQGIGSNGQQIILKANEQKYLALKVGTTSVSLQWYRRNGSEKFSHFSPVDSQDHKQWSMKRTELEGGTAWLDRRGMLHLRKASDQSELSLVLHDPHLAGWLSTTNETFGPSYFCSDTVEGVSFAHSVSRKSQDWINDFAIQCSPSISS